MSINWSFISKGKYSTENVLSKERRRKCPELNLLLNHMIELVIHKDGKKLVVNFFDLKPSSVQIL